MKKLVLLIAIFIILLSCKKENQIVVYSSSIIGEWNWLSTCGGFSGLCGTPKTTNSTSKLVFNLDSAYFEFWNDSLVSSYKFFVLDTPADYHTFGRLLINNKNYLYTIFHDTLNFMADGSEFSSMYNRIN
jgi:hypothetical protein